MAVLDKSIGEPVEEAVVKESIGESVDVIFELFPFVFHHLQMSNRLSVSNSSIFWILFTKFDNIMPIKYK